MHNPSLKEKIRKVLMDRRWHYHVDICKIVAPGCINVSTGQQISKLRKQGYCIESRIKDGTKMAEYRYRGHKCK